MTRVLMPFPTDAALASTIVFQMGLGLAFGYIFERSRNLVAPSLFHVLYNSMFSI